MQGLLVLVSGCENKANAPRGIRLDFHPDERGLRSVSQPLATLPNAPVQDVCPELVGERRWGSIPNRLLSEDDVSTANFIHFYVIYSGESSPVAVVDVDLDKKLACDELVPLAAYSGSPGRVARTLKIQRKSGGGVDRATKLRISVPKEFSDAAAYWVELVGSPTTAWNVGEWRSEWILYDGNHNGVYDLTFGDAVLVDMDGDGFDLSPRGEDLRSYHLPIILPWGAFTVEELDPEGKFLVLSEATNDLSGSPVLRQGEHVEALECSAADGSPISLGGATGEYQLVYFWFSGCQRCYEDVSVLNALHRESSHTSVRLVGVSLDDALPTFTEFIAQNSPDWPQCYVGRTAWDNAIAHRFGVTRPGEFILIDPKGTLLLLDRGATRARSEVDRLRNVSAALRP